ncbi:hypothetical protein CVT25_010770 [Psilocybe cyanescens]|uniref:Heterokaryon incompatibility domain-containing protein n=1 Tax=Psilocybe cyanescens TaxID=93625 RepID=A0A409VWQ3_PSICY|nr:hypothetical protein CVT25_010770 [Psilocybe cyanescens]
MTCLSALKNFLGFRITTKKKSSGDLFTSESGHSGITPLPVPASSSQIAPLIEGMPRNMLSPASEAHGEADPLKLICAACRAGPFSYEGFKYIYTTTWGTISQSVAKEGCNWCRLLIQNRDGLPDAKFPRGGPDEEVVIRIEIRVQSPVDWMDVTNNLYLYLNDYKAASYMIYAETDNVAAQEIGTGDHFRHDPSYVDYEKVKEWLKNCSDHSRCSRVEETPLPTRVIDCSDPTKPRLVLTQRRKGHFCALSYVWGGDQREKTTMANIDSHINEGFKVALPQTIADAILVTHNLGLQYLWVDALCIIQDSIEDKVIELANMAHIYQDAYVTLSVVSAFRADQGFLPDGREHVILPYHMKEGVDSSKHMGRMLMKYYIPRQNPHLGYKHQTVEVFEPLNERGWCLQESTLPPRKLVFKPPNVECECRTFIKDLTRASEGGEDDRPAFNFEANVPPIFSDSVKGVTANEGDGGEDLYDYWSQLLFDYTARKITVATDKLVAFSSMVEVFQKTINDEYIAGLWRGKLIDGLLWDPFGDIGPDQVLLPRSKEYRAPTWSWASVDLSVQAHQQHMFEAPSTEYEAEIISCQVTPKSTVNPFGEISDARLTMKVRMHPLMLDGRKCRFTERKGILSGDAMQSLYTSGGWVAPDGNCLQSKGKTPESSRDESEVTFDSTEGSEQDRDMDFYVIMLRAGRKWGDREDQPGWMMGLLVLKCEDEQETYRRVAKIELLYLPDWFDTVSSKIVTLV